MAENNITKVVSVSLDADERLWIIEALKTLLDAYANGGMLGNACERFPEDLDEYEKEKVGGLVTRMINA